VPVYSVNRDDDAVRSEWEIGIERSIRVKYPFLKIETSNRAIIPSRSTNGHLEIDIFIPSLSLGIEANGEQFHAHNQYDLDNYYGTEVSDEMYKQNYCRKHGIELIHVWSSDDMGTILATINTAIARKLADPSTKPWKAKTWLDSFIEWAKIVLILIGGVIAALAWMVCMLVAGSYLLFTAYWLITGGSAYWPDTWTWIAIIGFVVGIPFIEGWRFRRKRKTSLQNTSELEKVPATAVLISKHKCDRDDYYISNGLLYAYEGPGGHILIPDDTTEIYGSFGSGAFNGCRSLISVVVPEGVCSIGDYAFASCTGLKQIILPNSLINLGARAFSNCRNLTSISIPDNVSSIEDNTFEYCNNLASLKMSSSTTYIGKKAFAFCSSLGSVDIPAKVSSISESAFEYCQNLTSLSIPESVTSIGKDAFKKCGLTWEIKRTIKKRFGSKCL
jgi:hypothetical protein